jgi:hypothetical protein
MDRNWDQLGERALGSMGGQQRVVDAAFANPNSGYGPRQAANIGKQARIDHPLFKLCGYRRPPHWLWRLSPRVYGFVAACHDIWLIATGRLTLHRAWQAGYDDHSVREVERIVRANGLPSATGYGRMP